MSTMDHLFIYGTLQVSLASWNCFYRTYIPFWNCLFTKHMRLARPTNQNLKFLELWYLSRYGFENRWKPGVLDPVLYSWMPYGTVLKTDENLEFWIQCYIHECHTSLFGTWDFKSNQNLKFSGFYIWTYTVHGRTGSLKN